MRYPSRRAFLEMQSIPEFQELHVHKDAGMEQTIIMSGIPAGDWPEFDQPTVFSEGEVHLLEVVDRADLGDMNMTFDVEDWILGDGRHWDRFGFRTQPHTAVPRAHPEAAIVDRYSLVLQATVDRLRESIRDHPPVTAP